MLTVNLHVNSSPKNKLDKSLSEGSSFSCVLKESTSILRPIIILKSSNDIFDFNYMTIPDFDRSYFIDDIVSLNNDRWEITGHVDVLTTYKTAITSNTAVLRRQESNYNLYLDDPEFMVYNTEQISTYKFSKTEFNKTLSYVLIVNGS